VNLRVEGRVLRVGPKGAAALAPENTLRSLATAIEFSRAAVERAHRLGAAVLAWTVDDEPTLRRVVTAGVDGVITNDPRIFGATLST